MEANGLGLIFFLAVMSLGYGVMTGQLKPVIAGDATREETQKLLTSMASLPLLGVVVIVSAPHYSIGLAIAGFGLGFLLTLSRITHGISALMTEPIAIGILSLMTRRSSIGGGPRGVEEMLRSFGYPITADSLGYLSAGIGVGIVLAFIPRLFLKARNIEKAKQPQLNARQREIRRRKALEEKAILKTYSRKARKSGALVDRMRALK